MAGVQRIAITDYDRPSADNGDDFEGLLADNYRAADPMARYGKENDE